MSNRDKTHNPYNVLKVQQLTDKNVVVASIPFRDIMSFVRFTAREPNLKDPYDDNLNIVSTKESEYYQRLLDDERTKKISDYILFEINNKIDHNRPALGLFPTTLIIALDLNEEFDPKTDNGYEERLSELSPREVIYDDEKKVIHIPKIPFGLVVDGQHRLAGMDRLDRLAKDGLIKGNLSSAQIISKLDEFQYLCTILLGFDLWEQGKVFADVNFNQKPVNRSLYYDIFGSYPDPYKNDIYLAHTLILHLNNNNNSVLKGRIKLLGTGEGIFSQAFFVNAIIPLFRKDAVWKDLQYDFINNGSKHKFLPKFFRAYFAALKELFPEYWPHDDEKTSWKYKHILLKTTGLGALLKLIQDIYPRLKSNLSIEEVAENSIKVEIIRLLMPLKENAKDYFSKESEFASTGGGGPQNKLYKLLIKTLNW